MFEGKEHASLLLCNQFLKAVSYTSSLIVAGYMAQPDEMPVGPLMSALFSRGHCLCLPCTAPAGAELPFRAYRPGDRLVPGALAIPEPLPEAALVEPDILLVPLVGFDRQGNRLGQGGGFYDRTIKLLRARKEITAIGVGFSTQEEGVIPHDDRFDEKLNLIITEKGVIDPSF